MKKLVLLAMVATVLTIINGCQESDEQINQSVDLKLKEKVAKPYQPSYEVEVKDGMLVFESKMAFDVTKLEIATANRKAVDLWEQSLGIKTPANIFNAVVFAEDSISNYYESLPEGEQAYWREQPEIHSEIYQKALSEQIIQLVPDGEGGEYFDLNLYDKTVASVVTLDGLVIVDGQIHQYTSNAIKLITDGDIGKVEQLKKINATYQDDHMLVAVFDNKVSNGDKQLKSASFLSDNNWTRTANWQYATSKKRVKVWIDGHSEMSGAYAEDHCSEYASCTFVVRAEAMQKNFWGNWKYDSYMPSLSFNATWDYQYIQHDYDPNYPYPCTLYSHAVDNVPAYSCAPNPSYVCPTSPHSAYYPSVNNAYLNLTPHGVWQLSTNWFNYPFKVTHCTFTSTIDGKNFNYTW